MSGSEAEMREVAARICRDYLHGAWKSVKAQDLDFKRISGGLSNFLYYVALPEDTAKVRGAGYEVREPSPEQEKDKSPIGRFLRQRTLSRSNSFNMEEPKKVLLRIYGQVHGERALDAIVTESVIFTLLSERKLGPKLHGVFSGGRIEEYIPARSLLTKELSEPALSMKIAEKMAAIHSMDVPLMKEPNWLWKTMGRWLKTVNERLATAEAKDEHEERMIQKLKGVEFEKQIEWLKKYLSSVESPVVFCHNDMQEGNILLLEDFQLNNSDDEIHSDFAQFDESSTDVDSQKPTTSSKENNHTKSKTTLDTLRMQFAGENTTDSLSSHISDNGEPKLVLIDFEYCAYNYRGFDIANHFQEWAYDYTNPEHPFYYERQECCPSLDQKEIYIKEYLKHYLALTSEDKDEDTTPTIEDINQLLSEVEAFALASHLFWSLWSTVNATKSQIPFGYWDYAISRIETYFRLKQEIIKKDKYGFPQKRKICEVDI